MKQNEGKKVELRLLAGVWKDAKDSHGYKKNRGNKNNCAFLWGQGTRRCKETFVNGIPEHGELSMDQQSVAATCTPVTSLVHMLVGGRAG